jgi:hypothetical protein
VKHLCCLHIEVLDLMLSRGPVTHLYWQNMQDTFGLVHETIRKYQHKTLLLFLTMMHPTHKLSDCMVMDSSPYRHLQHFGRLDLNRAGVSDHH